MVTEFQFLTVVVAHTYYLSTQKAETENSELDHTWATQ